MAMRPGAAARLRAQEEHRYAHVTLVGAHELV
jgi:hypothetical protein